MRAQRQMKIAAATTLLIGALLTAARWIGQRPYVTPGKHQVFRLDSNPGALAACAVMLAALCACLFSMNAGGFRASRMAKTCTGIVAMYLSALIAISLLTPRTVVSIGDGYCWDLWCLAVEQVHAIPRGGTVFDTAEVRIFSDANRVSTYRDEGYLYALDDKGHRFPVFQNSSAPAALNLSIAPRESVRTTLSFYAPADSRKLYLTGDYRVMPWVHLYLASDLSPFHRRTLLRVI